MHNVYEQVDANKRKSVLIMVVFSVVISMSAYFISKGLSAYYGYPKTGFGIVGVSLVLSGLMSFGGYWWSDRIVLGLSGAKKASRKEFFHFFTVTENLSLGAGIPMPKLFVIEDSAPNAFATGRDPAHASVCATTGLLSKLDRTELEGVVAHELSHIQNYDTRLMAIVTVLVGLVTLLGDWFFRASWFGGRHDDREDRGSGGMLIAIGLVFAILAPIIAQLIQLAISRRREFLADASAVKLTRQPDGLARALLKISADREPLEVANKATAHLYIVNPFHFDSQTVPQSRHRGGVGWFAQLFNTHPPIEQRMKELQLMM